MTYNDIWPQLSYIYDMYIYDIAYWGHIYIYIIVCFPRSKMPGWCWRKGPARWWRPSGSSFKDKDMVRNLCNQPLARGHCCSFLIARYAWLNLNNNNNGHFEIF